MFRIFNPRFSIVKNSDGVEYLGCKLIDRGTDYLDTFPTGNSGKFRPPFGLEDAKQIAEQAYMLGRLEALKEARQALGIDDAAG